jgi:hypothetical protein
MSGPMSLEHGTGLRLGIIWAASLIFIYSLAQRTASTHCSTAVTAYPGINNYVCTFSSYMRPSTGYMYHTMSVPNFSEQALAAFAAFDPVRRAACLASEASHATWLEVDRSCSQ